MLLAFVLLCCAWTIHTSGVSALNIALHAQVLPNDKDKIVGSVITTDGLREAFLTRSYAKNVTIFYPSAYDGYFDVSWDLVIIEGWFLSIHQFIVLTRNHIPNAKIVFFCLDPTYPGLDELLSLDFDGVMTNSDLVLGELQKRGIPGSRHSLAADTRIMKPLPENIREISTVYVGAAGHMLMIKPFLKDMLLVAKKVGLHLYGTGWGAVPELKDTWRGTLPRYELARAYSKAHIVLASTIKSQDDYGMVNNRIYEALACGAIILSEYSHTLEKEFGDLIVYHNASWPVELRLSQILNQPPEDLTLHRSRARQFIEQHHTWLHRVIDMENFLFPLFADRFSHLHHQDKAMIRKSSQSVLIIVSNRILVNPDYHNVVEGAFLPFLRSQGMNVTEMHESELFSRSYNDEFLSQFHLLFAVCAAFDTVDLWMQQLQYPIYHHKTPPMPSGSTLHAILQRRGVYFFGSDIAGLASCFTSAEQYNRCADFSRYDAIFYRTNVELHFLRKYFPNKIPEGRLQHLMGVNMSRSTQKTLGKATKFAIFICFWSHRQLCVTEQHEEDFQNLKERYADQLAPSQRIDKILLLVGGASLSDWVALGHVVDHHQLHLTYHWSNAVHRQDIIHHLFQSAFFIRVVLPETSSQWRELPDHVAIPSEPAQLTSFKKEVETVDDSMSLLSAAAIAGARIHLLDYHHHWLTVAQSESADVWTFHPHMQEMMRNGVDRLLGLPPARARIQLENIDLQAEEEEKDVNMDGDIHGEKQYALGLTATSALKHYLFQELRLPFQVFRVSTEYVSMGKDTYLCLHNKDVNERNGTDDKEGLICTLRSFAYIVVVDGRTFDERHHETAQPRLWLSLRGTLFSNHSLRQSVPLSFTTGPNGASKSSSDFASDTPLSVLEEWNRKENKRELKWLLSSPQDDVVVYVYRPPMISNK